MEAYLHLQNGKTFAGKLETAWMGDIAGEVVFFTGMTGYQEVLTDPSYKNQIIVFTYPLIGNYGINEVDFESKQPHVKAVIVYEAEEAGYHYEAAYSLKQYLEKWNVPLLTHVDTRAVVKQIREHGAMPAVISTSRRAVVHVEEQAPVPLVSTSDIQTYGNGHMHVVLFDFGYKKSIVHSLMAYGCRVTVVPYNTTLQTVEQLEPDGVLLSNGPGDPKQLHRYLPNILTVIERYPTLAICLGHQLVSLAYGGDTEKLPFGHRGANQPVYDAKKKKVFMTSQNHGYVVKAESLAHTPLSIRFINVNDGSVEGVVHETKPILCVQYHPEAHPGPNDTQFIFAEFVDMMKAARKEKVYA
ncbi:carbamoyl phosphate synthase small subunit [Anoxybacillus sp. D401a]|uniref:carbamoyl phosphate synthase small subunit n=1 Tax=Anoxybacillus sp. D401a TaxID=575112 RepID=UPI003D330D47